MYTYNLYLNFKRFIQFHSTNASNQEFFVAFGARKKNRFSFQTGYDTCLEYFFCQKVAELNENSENIV